MILNYYIKTKKVKLKEIFNVRISKNSKDQNEILINGSNEYFDYLDILGKKIY